MVSLTLHTTGASAIQGGLQVSYNYTGRELEQDFSGTGNKFVFDPKSNPPDKERYRILIKDNNNPECLDRSTANELQFQVM